MNELGVSPGCTLEVIKTIRFLCYFCLKLDIVIKSTLLPILMMKYHQVSQQYFFFLSMDLSLICEIRVLKAWNKCRDSSMKSIQYLPGFDIGKKNSVHSRTCRLSCSLECLSLYI